MDSLTNLLQQYSFESIFIFIILLVVAFKFISEAFEWLWGKIRKVSNKQYKEEHFDEKFSKLEKNINNHFQNSDQKMVELEERLNLQFNESKLRIQDIDNRLIVMEERQQEATRSYLIESYHKFCKELKIIDELSLQEIERRYLYYKTAGGDGFIDNLMEEIRNLPLAPLANQKEENND